MGLKEIQLRIQQKKRKKRRRILRFFLLLLIIGFAVFLLRAPYFDVSSVSVSGHHKIEEQFVKDQAAPFLGNNIFLLKMDSLTPHLKRHPYFESAFVKRVLPNGISIHITERTGKVNYYVKGVVSILSEDGILLEVGANPIEGITLRDTLDIPELGKNLYESQPEKQKVLKEFIDLRERNTSEIDFTTIDLSDKTNIKIYYGEQEIRLGYGDSLQDKLNAAINVILAGHLDNIKGYLDLSYLENPVIFDETRIETPAEDGAETSVEESETPSDDDSEHGD